MGGPRRGRIPAALAGGTYLAGHSLDRSSGRVEKHLADPLDPDRVAANLRQSGGLRLDLLRGRGVPGRAAAGGTSLGGGYPMMGRSGSLTQSVAASSSAFGRVRRTEWIFPCVVAVALLGIAWVPYGVAFRTAPSSE